MEGATRTSAVVPGVRDHLWIGARHLFLRESARAHCWLWLHLETGALAALRMDAAHEGQDALLRPLARALLGRPRPADPSPESLGPAAALPDAPVVPLPRWSISWGHPVQREIRAFAAGLDADVLAALGALEAPGPFFGSVENYSRLASLPEPVRTHRLQALAEFPPLVAPLLLDLPERPDLLGAYSESLEDARAGDPLEDARAATVLDAMDRGRDLIGALAGHYRVSRGLVRSAPFRQPWSAGYAPRPLLRLLDALAPERRPASLADLERALPYLHALPVRPRGREDGARLAAAFKVGWNPLWSECERRFAPLTLALEDARDFLRAAADHAAWLRPEQTAPDADTLGLAWLARRGLPSLLAASRRWHQAPAPADDAEPPGLPKRVAPLIGDWTSAEGRARELASRAELIAEGGDMAHCVAGYWPDCVLEGTRIFHLAGTDGEAATAEYGFDPDPVSPRFALGQLRGPRNALPGRPLAVLARALEDVLNAEERLDARRRHAGEALAERARQPYRPTRGRRVAPLDREGQRELLRVLADLPAPPPAPGERWRGFIAGYQYHRGPALEAGFDVGDELTLVRERDNPHDPRAVRIDWRGAKLGYVPRTANIPIAGLLDAGVRLTARILGVDPPAEHWERVECVILEESAPRAMCGDRAA